MFFNQTLSSTVGGDAMRVWLLARNRCTFGKAVSSVPCDRVLALIVPTALSAAALPLFYDHSRLAGAKPRGDSPGQTPGGPALARSATADRGWRSVATDALPKKVDASVHTTARSPGSMASVADMVRDNIRLMEHLTDMRGDRGTAVHVRA